MDAKVPEVQLLITQDARVSAAGTVAGSVDASQVLLHVACPVWSLYLPDSEHNVHAPPVPALYLPIMQSWHPFASPVAADLPALQSMQLVI